MTRQKSIISIIQAHMSSTRLPHKIVLDLCGQPALYRMIERVRQSKMLDNIVIATSTETCDDIVVELCKEWGVHTFRGSDSDVLSRYWGAAQEFPADVYVRMTSDCPLMVSDVVDKTVSFFLENNFRYVSNSIDSGNFERKSNYPDGIGCEVFSRSLLQEAAQNATEPYEHEHVTPYMYWKQDSIGALPGNEDLSMFRITLDTKEDYEVISRVYDALYQPGNTFNLDDIIRYLEAHPEVVAINDHVIQKKTMESTEKMLA